MENIVVKSTAELKGAVESHPEIAEYLKTIRTLQAEVRNRLSGLSVSTKLETFLSEKSDVTITEDQATVGFNEHTPEELESLKKEVEQYMLFKEVLHQLEEALRATESELQHAKKRRNERFGKFGDTLNHAFSFMSKEQEKLVLDALATASKTNMAELESALQNILPDFSQEDKETYDSELKAVKADKKFIKKLEALNTAGLEENEGTKMNIEADLHLLKQKMEDGSLNMEFLDDLCDKFGIEKNGGNKAFEDLVQLMSLQQVVGYLVDNSSDFNDQVTSQVNRQKNIKIITALFLALGSIGALGVFISTLQIARNNQELRQSRKPSNSEKKDDVSPVKTSQDSPLKTYKNLGEFIKARSEAKETGVLNSLDAYRMEDGNIILFSFEGKDDPWRTTIDNDASLTKVENVDVSSFQDDQQITYVIQLANGIHHIYQTKTYYDYEGNLVCIGSEDVYFQGLEGLTNNTHFVSRIVGENQIEFTVRGRIDEYNQAKVRILEDVGEPLSALNLSDRLVAKLISEKPY